ncbi:GNAT family N-acetyltransferase [uncultured Modestobacter sp.]|uniref:GNAT family N-acetyltransferase n=1 Tax=uncultured Modestobacter sp. TaxID=380048 RepID=UPI002623F6E2|nr:GNAT family N-acetyltransferase [uncultured Modestobacter sp.]
MEARPYLVLDLSRPLPEVDRTGVRVAREADLPAMAEVMAEAYRGTVDDEGEDQPAALAELRSTAAGTHGPPLPDAWLLAEEAGEVAAAVVCTRWQGLPFVAQAVTHPRWQRRGHGTRLLLAAATTLRAGGETRLSLIVTRRNPAHALYQRLGFTEIPWPEGT